VDKWNVDISYDQAGRADLMFILKNPPKHRVLEVSQLIIDLKEGFAKGPLWSGSNRRKAGVQNGVQKTGVGR
jgi:hypothetical protein